MKKTKKKMGQYLYYYPNEIRDYFCAEYHYRFDGFGRYAMIDYIALFVGLNVKKYHHKNMRPSCYNRSGMIFRRVRSRDCAKVLNLE